MYKYSQSIQPRHSQQTTLKYPLNYQIINPAAETVHCAHTHMHEGGDWRLQQSLLFTACRGKITERFQNEPGGKLEYEDGFTVVLRERRRDGWRDGRMEEGLGMRVEGSVE